MEIKVSDFAGAVFVLYLLISSNFQAQLFPCRVQALLNNSQTVKHLLGFLTMTFFVVLANSKNKLPVAQLFLISFVSYLWFMMSAKMNMHVWFLMMFILATVFLLQVYKDHQEVENDAETQAKVDAAGKAQEILSYVVAALTLLGFVIYMGEKRIEYGDNFEFGTFFLGNPSCKGESPNVSLRNALRAVAGRRGN